MFPGLQTACASLSTTCRVSLTDVGTSVRTYDCTTQLPGARLLREKSPDMAKATLNFSKSPQREHSKVVG